MRKKLSPYQSQHVYFIPQIGWLFADLLLAMGMIFLIASPPPPVPSIHKVVPTPTPTPQQGRLIETTSQLFVISLTMAQADGLSQGDPDAMAALEHDVRVKLTAQHFNKRVAAIVIANGGTTQDNLQRGNNMSQHTYEALQVLGSEHFVFCQASYYDQLFALDIAPNQVALHIFFLNKSFTHC